MDFYLGTFCIFPFRFTFGIPGVDLNSHGLHKSTRPLFTGWYSPTPPTTFEGVNALHPPLSGGETKKQAKTFENMAENIPCVGVSFIHRDSSGPGTTVASCASVAASLSRSDGVCQRDVCGSVMVAENHHMEGPNAAQNIDPFVMVCICRIGHRHRKKFKKKSDQRDGISKKI